MANGYQKHILIGNLGADPRVGKTRNGNLVTNFDIAVNERNGDGTETVTWYGITVWNGLGEACAQYLTKGRQVMVEGTRLEVTAWMGRDGNLYTKMELTANEVKFLGGNGSSEHKEPVQQQQAPVQQQASVRRQSAARQKQASVRRQSVQRKQQAPARQKQAPQYIPDNPEDIAF